MYNTWVSMFGEYFCALCTPHYVPEYIIIDMSVKAGTPTDQMCGIPMHICSIISVIYNIILCHTMCRVGNREADSNIYRILHSDEYPKKKKVRNKPLGL